MAVLLEPIPEEQARAPSPFPSKSSVRGRLPSSPSPRPIASQAAPLVANPEFVDDPSIARRCDGCAGLALELWQLKGGTIFDNILLTDSEDEADAPKKKTK